MRPMLAVVVAFFALAPAGSAAPDGALPGIAASLNRMAAAGRFSGDVLIAKDGRPVLQRHYGVANRATREPNRPGTRFNLASLGKPLTAVAVARLVDEGKLRFDDRIGRYLPELPSDLRAITVAQLLDHTSGLGDFFSSPDYERLRPKLTTLRRYLPLIVGSPPEVPPGSFHYSNSGYILLGLIVERVSGGDYYAFLRRQVLAPAGMTHTACLWRTKLGRGTAIGYTRVGHAFRANTSGLAPRGASAGGCYSTVGDLLAFANALLSHRLLSASVTDTITSPKVSDGHGGAYGYGFGIRPGRPGDPPTVWHNGGAPGVGAELDVNAKLGYTVVVLSNLSYPTVAPAIDVILNRLRIP
jgi:CubicO group peptidase (beta-lactamase class C family)